MPDPGDAAAAELSAGSHLPGTGTGDRPPTARGLTTAGDWKHNRWPSRLLRMLSWCPDLMQRWQPPRFWFELDRGDIILLGPNSAALYENHPHCPSAELFMLTVVLCPKHFSLLSHQKTGFTPDMLGFVPLPTRTGH